MLFSSMSLNTEKSSSFTVLLATDGMLVKRPIIVSEDTVLVGFKVKEWEEKLL